MMQEISNTLWTVGMLLQAALLAVLVARRAAWEVPWFTGLVGFYVARAGVLFAVFSHVSRDAYGALSVGLSVVDLLLQMAVAWEITGGLRRARAPGWWGPLRLGLVMLAAGWLTAGVVWALPARSPAPIDRAAVFCGFLFVLLAGWGAFVPLGRVRGSVLAGMALLGVGTVVSQAAKTVAAFHRQTHAFVVWSYVAGGVYVAALVVWIVLLGRHGKGLRIVAERGSVLGVSRLIEG